MWITTLHARLRTLQCLALGLSTALLVLFGLSAQSALCAQAVGPFLDGNFPSARPGTDPAATWTVHDALPNIRFVEPLRVVPHPNGAELIVVSKDGDLWLVDDNSAATSKTLFLHVAAQFPAIGEGGASGFAFHPQFGVTGHPERGSVFVWYRWAPTPGLANYNTPGYDRLSKFTVPVGMSVADPNTEVVLLQQFDRDQYHIAGDLQFGLDGFLYIPVGDEGNGYPRFQSTQRIESGFFSGCLRIDVDNDPARSHAIRRQPTNVGVPPAGFPDSFTQGYGIPNDNPWIDPAGSVLEEFFAVGLRHAWTMQLDTQTGFMWFGDVGQAAFEELNMLERGANYQWAYKEADAPALLGMPSNILGFERGPVWAYDRTMGQCIMTGGIYRGGLYPELYGQAIVYDFLQGSLWAVDPLQDPPAVTLLATLPSDYSAGLTSIRYLADGRIVGTQEAGGLVDQGKLLEILRVGTPSPEPPALLSQTGFFTDLMTLTTHAAAHAYEMITPFWSDHAEKERWFLVPNDGVIDSTDEQISIADDDHWEFPVGSVLVKHIEKQLDEVSATTSKRLETRFFVHANDGWYGVTYRWRADGTEADLLTGAESETFSVVTDAGTIDQTWAYPSRLQCLRCHTGNAGSSLGPKTGQLNRDVQTVGAGMQNQLELFDGLGLLNPSLNGMSPELLPRFAALEDETFSQTERVRSYFDSNCSSCHQPGGVIGAFDARFSTPFCEQGFLYGPVQESLGIQGAAVVMPGQPERSLAHLRIGAVGSEAMPPLAKARVDEEFLALFTAWIEGVDDEIVIGNATDTDAPFLDTYQAAFHVNEADAYVHPVGDVEFIHPTEVRFYARRLGNPITPFVARWEGEDAVTILAIGTTREAGEYVVGENSFPFRDQFTPSLFVAPGERLVVGFMDMFPDGQGWGAGPVIPAEVDFAADEMWELHPTPLIAANAVFDPLRETASIVEGERPSFTNQGLNLGKHIAFEKSYRLAIVLRGGCAPDEDADTTVIPLGVFGGATDSDAATLDVWLSNLVILEGAAYTNESAFDQALRIDTVEFYARALADPITPFVVRVDGSGQFTVLAIGSTRSVYAAGQNMFTFDEVGAPVVTLGAGEQLAIGFLDALPDGTGGGLGASIPSDLGTGTSVWRSGGPTAIDSGSITLGAAVTAGSQTVASELRDVRFSIQATRLDELLIGQTEFDAQGAALDVWSSNLIVNLTDGWTNTSGLDRKLSVDTFGFYATRVADPVTPFVVRYAADGSSEVLAIGTTRATYSSGINLLAFDDGGTAEVVLRSGESLVAGFLDALPDGTGGGLGSPIPFSASTNGAILHTGGLLGTSSGSVTVGDAPVHGDLTLAGEAFEYLFGIEISGLEFVPADCDNDGIPDTSEPDCDADGVPDDCEGENDCNQNGVPDSCDRITGHLGRSTPIGFGTAGSGGFTPAANFEGCIDVMTPFELRVEHGLGGAFGFLVLTRHLTALPLLGGVLYAGPPFMIQSTHVLGGVGPGQGDYVQVVQVDQLASSQGETFYLQIAYLDPLGPGGISFTQGVRLELAWQQ